MLILEQIGIIGLIIHKNLELVSKNGLWLLIISYLG